MQSYSPEMYNEILKDWNYRYGKFDPINYPKLSQRVDKLTEESNNEKVD